MKISTVRWIVLALLCASTVINYVDRQALAVLIPQLRSDLHLSSYDYGLIMTAFMSAYTVGQIGSGVFIDRVGTRVGFMISIAVWSVAAMGHAFANGLWSLVILRCVLGLGEAGNWPAGGKAVAEWFPRERRAFAMGLFDGGSAAGAVLAPPLVAALALSFGWRTAFVATGAAGFLWLAAWAASYWRPSEHPWLRASERDTEVRAQDAPEQRPLSVVSLLSSRKLWGLMLTRMVATPVWWFYVFWLPDYLSKERGFGLHEIGMFGWIPFLTVDAGKLLGGGVSDALLRRGWSPTVARKSVMGVAAIAMLGGVRVAGAASAGGAIAWVSVATFGFGMWSANILALHTDIFPRGAIGTVIGWTGTAASLGGALFTYVTGTVVQNHGYAPMFWTAGVTALLALVVLIVILGRVEPIRPAEAAI
jgi:ACS family hexuronate transporter-like MFS transporter